MIMLHHGTGSRSFSLLDSVPRQTTENLLFRVRRVLSARGLHAGLRLLDTVPFDLYSASNDFNDEFEILYSEVGLEQYEQIRATASALRAAAEEVATVANEIGNHYIRFIAVDLTEFTPEEWDVFVCYAGEDRPAVVEPLVNALESAGIHAWYAPGQVLWGDSIVQKINEGLSRSRFVVVVISDAFFRKNWPQSELRAALMSEIESGETRVLPLFVGNEEEKNRMLTSLALGRDKRYLSWLNDPTAIVEELHLLLRRGRRAP